MASSSSSKCPYLHGQSQAKPNAKSKYSCKKTDCRCKRRKNKKCEDKKNKRPCDPCHKIDDEIYNLLVADITFDQAILERFSLHVQRF